MLYQHCDESKHKIADISGVGLGSIARILDITLFYVFHTTVHTNVAYATVKTL